jgi:hypothetical protein
LERKTQNPNKSDGGNPGNQTKRLNSLHGKHEQVSLSLNNHAILCSSICVKTPNTFRAVSNGVSFMMKVLKSQVAKFTCNPETYNVKIKMFNLTKIIFV